MCQIKQSIDWNQNTDRFNRCLSEKHDTIINWLTVPSLRGQAKIWGLAGFHSRTFPIFQASKKHDRKNECDVLNVHSDIPHRLCHRLIDCYKEVFSVAWPFVFSHQSAIKHVIQFAVLICTINNISPKFFGFIAASKRNLLKEGNGNDSKRSFPKNKLNNYIEKERFRVKKIVITNSPISSETCDCISLQLMWPKDSCRIRLLWPR